MAASNDRVVLGLTGSFGSGCSTLVESLTGLGFVPFSLSDYVKKTWSKKLESQLTKPSDLNCKMLAMNFEKRMEITILRDCWQKELKLELKENAV